MKDILARANRLADQGQKKLDTGHLLLALCSAKDLASTLLKDRGAGTARVKEQLARLPSEPASAMDAALGRARQIAVQCQSPRVSGLHVLACLAVKDGGRAAAALESLGIDVVELQTQALRRLTGLDRGQGNASSSDERQQLVLEPLAQPLRANTPFSTARAEATATAASGARTSNAPPPISAGRLLDMGRSLESVQRRTRAMRNPLSPDVVVELPQTPPQPAQRSPRKRPASASFALPDKGAPLLRRHGRNLTKEASEGVLPPVIERGDEIERMVDVLSKHSHNCPCVVGPTGVGKTSLIHGLAHAIARGEHAPRAGSILIELGGMELIAACAGRGGPTERTESLRRELTELRGKAVLVLDDLGALAATVESAELLAELRAAVGRGELTCIACTSDKDYKRHVESDALFARHLVPLELTEPNEELCLEIVSVAAPRYSTHHDLPFEPETLRTAVRLSSRYLSEGALPDKALCALDLAAGRARRLGRPTVAPLDVAELLSQKIGVPADRLAASDNERLLHIEELLGERVIGHTDALGSIAETLRRNAAGFRGHRPIGSFLLLGPTGVGKTETAKALAELLFPGPGAFVRLDMSEFGEAHTVARLIGAPPGYIGHEDGGQLTEAVRRRPYCLVLLDEIEKAHRDVLQILLQVLDDGRLTDGRGRTVRFDNAIIIMTSNLGHHATATKRGVGFGRSDRASERLQAGEAVLDAARALLPVELWNRIDEPLVFGALSREDILRIAALLVHRAGQQLFREHGVVLRVENSAHEALVDGGGYDDALGARPMRRAVQRLVEAPLARLVLQGQLRHGDVVLATGQGPQVFLTPSNPSQGAVAI